MIAAVNHQYVDIYLRSQHCSLRMQRQINSIFASNFWHSYQCDSTAPDLLICLMKAVIYGDAHGHDNDRAQDLKPLIVKCMLYIYCR